MVAGHLQSLLPTAAAAAAAASAAAASAAAAAVACCRRCCYRGSAFEPAVFCLQRPSKVHVQQPQEAGHACRICPCHLLPKISAKRIIIMLSDYARLAKDVTQR
jgi:hypothetical protein